MPWDLKLFGNSPPSTYFRQQLNYFQMPVIIDAVPSPDSL
jgi:hypothetical protein